MKKWHDEEKTTSCSDESATDEDMPELGKVERKKTENQKTVTNNNEGK